jgi:asparagine synthase (glutamine-hydrolysing)
MTWQWDEADKRALWPSFGGRDSVAILERMYAESSSPDLLDQMLSVLQKSWLVEDLLMKADKMSMATSLELRVPFLDYRIVEWANRQPVGAKIGELGGKDVTKRVLRRFAMKRLPREIIDRPKMGFPVPVSRWLQDEQFARWAAEFLTGRDARISRLFQPGEIQRHLRLAAAGDASVGDNCWLLLVLETWFREYDVSVDAEISPAAYTSAAAAV